MALSILKKALTAGVLAGSLMATAAVAVPISSYEGELSEGVTVYGLIGEPNGGSPYDDFWWFEGSAGDVIDLIGLRLDGALDLALRLYFGTGTDTDDLTLLASADDEIPNPGPFGDPYLASFVLPSTGDYTVQMWSFLSGTLDASLDVNYELTGYDVGRVPAPAALGLLGLGLAGLGMARRRK